MNQINTNSSVLSPQSSHKPKHWLVTGGCGFIGASLIKRLLQDYPDVKIRVLDNLSVGTRDDLASVCDFKELDPSHFNPQSSALSPQSSVLSPKSSACSAEVQLIIGDICNAELTADVSRGVDAIVHLAANTGVGPSVEKPRADMEANVMGTFNMLEAARQHNVKRFIFASSGAPVGECTPPIHEELAPHPVSPYGASKLAGEGYCSAFFRTFGVGTVALRFGNVYGPGSGHKNSVVAKFIKQAVDGETCEIYGDGTQTRDFIFISDLIDAIIKAAYVSNVGGETFQIATSKEHTVNEIVEMIKRELSQHEITMTVTHGETRIGDVKRNFSDTSKARELLKWEAKTQLKTGIEKTVDWFLEVEGNKRYLNS